MVQTFAGHVGTVGVQALNLTFRKSILACESRLLFSVRTFVSILRLCWTLTLTPVFLTDL